MLRIRNGSINLIKENKMKWILPLSAMFTLLAGEGCQKPPQDPTSVSHSGEYDVAGTGGCTHADITYTPANGGTQQLSNQLLPWSYTFSANGGTFVYVSAQNDQSSGTVTTTIKEDNSTLFTNSSSGAYVIATSDGSFN
jgi:hypothetical protein